MNQPRTVEKIFHAKPVLEGAGVKLSRAFGNYDAPQLDPFLMLDDFHSSDPNDYMAGFPWHPHRGIETVTYVLRGGIEHRDSMGNTGVIGDGDIQWMTAGSGIVHQEMPVDQQGGTFHGFQLWVNLPAKNKMMHPRYRDVQAEHVPTVEPKPGVLVKVVAGEVAGVTGPVGELVVDVDYFDISVAEGASYQHQTKTGYRTVLYVVEGETLFGHGAGHSGDDDRRGYTETGSGGTDSFDDVAEARRAGPRTTFAFSDGDHIVVTGGKTGARFLLLSGAPIGEPVAWRGPIVMNTVEELDTAFREYSEGTFLKHDAESFKY